MAVYVLPTLAESGQIGHSLETLSAKTGLTRQRVHACLGFLPEAPLHPSERADGQRTSDLRG
ncbi:hypothetical protein ACFYOY_05020 [Streptomyces sp. NPDC007875]|uniref:hypothetical protein n=1 Tax=Streptomyces sp. NPDC007875 TaxID=3364783 RepID=UPI00368EEFB3